MDFFSTGWRFIRPGCAVFIVVFFCVGTALAELPEQTSDMLRRASNTPGVGALRSAVIQAIALNPEQFSDIVILAMQLAPEQKNAITAAIVKTYPGFTLSPVPHAERVASQWFGEAELGGSRTSGNTETEILSTAFQLENVRERWRENFNVALDLAREDSETFSRRLFAESESRYVLNDLFLFAFGSMEKDRFSAFEYRLSEAVGIGYRLVETKDYTLEVEVGPGVRQSRLRDNNNFEGEYTGRLVAVAEWRVLANARLNHKTATTFGTVRTLLETKTSYTTDMRDDLALRLSFELRHNTSVPGETRNTDTLFKVSIVYRIGM